MRVLIATPLYPPETGGAATYAKLLEEGLPARGVEVVFVTFSDVKRVPKGLRRLAYFFKIYRAAKDCDLIYALEDVSVGVPSMWVARLLRKPFVVKIVGDYAWEQGLQRFKVTQTLDEFVVQNMKPALRRYRRIQTNVAMHAKRVVVPSEYVKHIVRTWGIPDEHIRVIYNSVSHNEIEHLGQAPEDIHALPRPLIVSAGHLVPSKHFEGVIEAVRTLRDRGVHASLAILGGGPDLVPLQDLVRRKLPEGGWALTGERPHEAVLASIAAADVFVLNSSYESLSHALIEATLIGTPIVATNVGGNPEVVAEGENGLLVRSGDATALADAIAREIGDAQLRTRMSSNKAKAAEKFRDTTMLDRTAALLKDPNEGRMRVLQIGADRSPRGVLYPGTPAFERQQAYARSLGKLDIIGFARSFDPAKPYIDEQLTVTPTNSASALFYGLDAYRIQGRLPRPDVVSVQDPFEAGLIGLFIAWNLGVPLHVQVHTDILSPEYARLSPLNPIRVRIAGFVLRRATRIRVVSQRIKTTIEEYYQLKAPVTVLPIFADVEKARGAHANPDCALRVSKYSKKILVVSRLEREKNVALAIEAFADAAPPDACLIIVGDGRERARLEGQKYEFGVAERLFFEGERPAWEYYPIADLVLVPSKYEGYGLVIVEALAAGKPVLSTDVGVAREAGAIVSNEKAFASDLRAWFKSGPRTAELKGYPYKNFDEYVRAYCEDIRASNK